MRAASAAPLAHTLATARPSQHASAPVLAAAPGRALLYIAFMRMGAEDTSRHVTNRLAAAFTSSDIIHTELYFPATGETVGIRAGQSVYKTNEKNFNRRGWFAVQLNISQTAYTAAYTAAIRLVGQPFDANYTFWYPVAWASRLACMRVSPATPGTWVCSRVVARVLVDARIWSIDEYAVSAATPASVYETAMAGGGQMVGLTPGEMKAAHVATTHFS